MCFKSLIKHEPLVLLTLQLLDELFNQLLELRLPVLSYGGFFVENLVNEYIDVSAVCILLRSQVE
jgi:hypothetical protein